MADWFRLFGISLAGFCFRLGVLDPAVPFALSIAERLVLGDGGRRLVFLPGRGNVPDVLIIGLTARPRRPLPPRPYRRPKRHDPSLAPQALRSHAAGSMPRRSRAGHQSFSLEHLQMPFLRTPRQSGCISAASNATARRSCGRRAARCRVARTRRDSVPSPHPLRARNRDR